MKYSRKWTAVYLREVELLSYSATAGTSYNGAFTFQQVSSVRRTFMYVHYTGTVYENTHEGYYHVAQNVTEETLKADPAFRYVPRLEHLLKAYPRPPTLSKQVKNKIHQNRKARNTAPR